MSDLRMEFTPATLLPAQQPQITQFCRTVRTNNWSELGSSTTAIVYSHNSQWWHTTTNDPTSHVTVRYDRRVPATRRVHIYKNGSANLFPHTGLDQDRATTTAVAKSEEGSDGYPEDF